MLVHLFGTTSSPSCVNFAIHKTAEDNANDIVVKKNFYVEDCLKSFSNSAAVIESIPESKSWRCQAYEFCAIYYTASIGEELRCCNR